MNGKKPVKTIKPLVLRFSRFLVRLFLKVFFGCSYHYEQPLSLEGPVIFASNHQSYLDPPTVGAGIAKGIYFMAKQELFSNRFFGALIGFYNAVPVRRGVMDWRAVARIKEILKTGGAVLVFPEGTRSRDGHLGKARFGAGLLAQETGAVIVPVYVRGTDRLLAALLRKRPMAVFYGCPLPPEQYGSFERSTRGQLAVSELIMQRISCMQQAYDTVDFTRAVSGPEKS
ncbi:MAG: 1-acyl-sn-glycerol-3-phosphate acyltransferase [Candidatus Glassbacteria bacterium]|nr:1-acyl-sn-glycerol-3-phosphate acyltransferase [Candidatus Glassbacteria bacterium]